MFVSSYSTYINTSATERNQKERVDASKESGSSFSKKLDTTLSTEVTKASHLLKNQLPVNYVSNYKVLNNQQKLQQESSKAQIKFTQVSTLQNAKVAYSDNSQMFSFLQKPKVTLDQTPKINTKMPTQAQEGQEKSLRHLMINTYIANDSYYKITA